MIIISPEGVEVECYVTETDGMIDAMIRADTQADWEAAALSAEILEIVDGELTPVRGNHIDVIDPAIIAVGAYSEDGTVISAPVYDDRYHVNLRVSEPALSSVDDSGYPKWKSTVLLWMQHGTDDTTPNKNESGKKLQQVTLIDPDTVSSPQRRWL